MYALLWPGGVTVSYSSLYSFRPLAAPALFTKPFMSYGLAGFWYSKP